MGELPNAPIPDPHVPQTEGLQIGDDRLSISCAVVERPDHHCIGLPCKLHFWISGLAIYVGSHYHFRNTIQKISILN